MIFFFQINYENLGKKVIRKTSNESTSLKKKLTIKKKFSKNLTDKTFENLRQKFLVKENFIRKNSTKYYLSFI